MTQFYAQPYDLAASGFYFEDAETYKAKMGKVRNDYTEATINGQGIVYAN